MEEMMKTIGERRRGKCTIYLRLHLDKYMRCIAKREVYTRGLYETL